MEYETKKCRICLICLISSFLIAGCAHKYTQNEYTAVTMELNTCQEELDQIRQEKTVLNKRMLDTEKDLDEKDSQLKACMSAKQKMLDKNIECLEENKLILKQISRFKDVIQEKKETRWRLNKDYEFILTFLGKERINDQVYIIRGNDNIKIVLTQKVLFPSSGSAWLTPRGKRLVQKIASGIKRMDPSYIKIAGHTDNRPIPDDTRHVYPSNWDLSQSRALSVLNVFDNMGIKKDRMCGISYGESMPISDNATAKGRAMNRRVEIIIIP